MRQDCKRCNIKTVLSPDDIERMVREVEAMKGVRLAEKEVYDARIAVCMACGQFEYGSTCMRCGCVMQVRARLLEGRCPEKKWER
jgi:hypothetical protein